MPGPKKLTFEEQELAILRSAVDRAQKRTKRMNIMMPLHKAMVSVVEQFLRKTKCLCYGGTAINNILPVNDQFYDKSLEMPDYDFYSPHALKHAKELANIYSKEGFTDVEAKAGVHYGTYKVFVNYIPVADITQMNNGLYKELLKDAIHVNSILYAPPDFLRMAMYLELSRPNGDVSRWEKVQKRLVLLNKNYPLKNPLCTYIDFQRGFETNTVDKKKEGVIYELVRNSFINQGLVFFGGYANNLLSRYMPKHLQKKIANIPDFDVLSDDPKMSAIMLKERLEYEGCENISYKRHEGVGEIIAPHYAVSYTHLTLPTICSV